MMSNDTYTLTQALKGVFVDPHMVDQSTNKSGPSFNELTRMEQFWQVGKTTQRKTQECFFFYLIVYDRSGCSWSVYRKLVQ